MRPLLSIATLLCAASPLAAQSQPGDWVFTDLNNATLWRLDPANGAITALPTALAGVLNACTMGADNRDVVVAAFGTSTLHHLYAVAPSGAATLLGPVGNPPSTNGPNAIDLDQDGTWVCSEASTNAIWRVDPVTRTSSLLMSTAAYANALCIDQDTGDYVAGVYGAGTLLRFDRRTRVPTLLASGLGNLSGVDFEPSTGSFVVTTFSSPQVRRVARTGGVTTLFTLTNANAVKVDDETGNLLVASGTVQAVNTIVLRAADGTPLRSWSAGNRTPTGVELYGSRKVSGFGPALPGTTYTIELAFPRSPSAGYVVLLSVGLRPGIPLNDGTGRRIHVDANTLHIGDLPGFTNGFVGTLDAGGRTRATIALPAWFPANVRLFVTAVAANGALGRGFDTANTWAFTIN
jgi:hypothetical protein